MRFFVWAAGVVALAALFLSLGFLFVRQCGPQEDEVQFAGALLAPREAAAFTTLGGQTVPLMLMPYAGGLKAILYNGIFRDWPPDVRSLRIPVLLLGTAAVLLWALFFFLTLPRGVALAATALLATEPVFLIGTVMDWGIVAMQHFLWGAAMALLALFHRSRRDALLGAAAFFIGLALWDKLTSVWVLAGWSVAALVCLRPQLRQLFSRRRLAIAALWMTVGCAPVLYYNAVKTRAATAGASGGLHVPGRLQVEVLRRSLNGSALFGYLTRDDARNESEGETAVEQALVRLSAATGHLEAHLLLAVVLGAVLGWPLLRGSREGSIIGFATVAFAVGWLTMLPFRLGGAGAHHLVLLWPLPQMMAAAALAGLGANVPRFRRAVFVGSTAMLAMAGVLVTVEYYSRIVRRGPADLFSDAAHPLAQALTATPAAGIFSVDWGIVGPVRFLGRGKLPLVLANPYWEERDPVVRRGKIDTLFDAPHLVVIYAQRQHLDNRRYYTLLSEARQRGYREELVQEIRDRHGRPIYRLLRFQN